MVILGSGRTAKPLALAFAAASRRRSPSSSARTWAAPVNTGCTPTKTLVASARVAYLARRAGDFEVHTSAVNVDMARGAASGNAGSSPVYRPRAARPSGPSRSVELMLTAGRIVGPRQLEVSLNNKASSRRIAGEVVR